MNRLEFNEVMKAVGINNPLSTAEGRYGTREEVHYWNNLAICFGGSYYTIVNGRIPLEVANIIYQKYPGNPYDIRVDGGCKDWNPIDWATDEKFEKDIQRYNQRYIEDDLDVDEYSSKYENAKRNFKRRKNIDDKYLKAYHIDSKEGLLIFLTEMKDYFLRKNNLPETEVKKYDELITKITSEIFKKVNPYISAYDWMQDDKENKSKYNSSIERDNKTKLGQTFRKTILDFDKAVNPFLNDDIELDEISNYINNIEINANSYNSEHGKYRQGCCSLEITDISTGNKTTYCRNPDGFSFQLSYKLGEEKYLEILHYFSTSGNFESDKGEVIAIYYCGDNVENKIDIRLNITNGKAGKTYEDKIPATPEQIAFVYDELSKATSYASEVTIENMKKKVNTKQLVLNNN